MRLRRMLVGQNVLLAAARHNSAEMVELLVMEGGLEPSHPLDSLDPVYFAMKYSNDETMGALLALGGHQVDTVKTWDVALWEKGILPHPRLTERRDGAFGCRIKRKVPDES